MHLSKDNYITREQLFDFFYREIVIEPLSLDSAREFLERVRERVQSVKHAARRILPVRVRSRARSVRRHGRHVSRSSFAVAADSGGGGDDGGDGQSDSDCNRAFVLWGKGEFCVVSARLGGLSLNDRINGIIVSRYRALPAQAREAQGDGRFFVPFRRWAA